MRLWPSQKPLGPYNPQGVSSPSSTPPFTNEEMGQQVVAESRATTHMSHLVQKPSPAFIEGAASPRTATEQPAPSEWHAAGWQCVKAPAWLGSRESWRLETGVYLLNPWWLLCLSTHAWYSVCLQIPECILKLAPAWATSYMECTSKVSSVW